MAGQERALEISQAGIESTRGTAVAATRKVYTAWQPFTYTRELRWSANQTGTFHNRREANYARPVHGFTGTESCSFEDMAWWLQFILKGGVTGGAGDSGTPEMFTYTFTPTLASDDLKSMTLEYGTPTLPYEANQVMVNSATFRFDPDNQTDWEMDVEAMARKPTQTAMTGAISERTRELIKGPGTLIYIDSSSIGSTQVTGRFIGGSITINNNLDFKAFAEDVDDYAANKVGRGDVTVDAQFTFEFDSDTEYALYRGTGAPTERLISVQRTGEIIHDAVRSKATFNLNGYWSSVTPDYRNNNKILTFGLGARYNTSSAYALNAVILNDVETLA